MAISKKLEIIYHNGQPDGIRSIHRHLSTMTTYVIPRPLLSEAKKMTGINRPGIYYLISETDDNKIAQIYVGQFIIPLRLLTDECASPILHGLPVPGNFADQTFVHNGHEHQNHQQIRRQQRNGNMLGEQTKQRRHQAGAHIGAGHLNADDCLRPVRTEMRRG